jgi:D-cysteine desulfhydrase
LAGLETRVVAVRVYGRLFANAYPLALLANRTAALLRVRGGPDAGRFPPRDFEVVHDQFGEGYGHSTPAADAALARAAEAGLRLETTYSAKALAAVLASGHKGVLFWNTFSSVAPTAVGLVEELPRGIQRML